MRSTTNHSTVSTFPDYIEKQLAEPWSGNTRHESWTELALQMVGEQKKNPALTDDVIFQRLRQWIPDDDKPNSELTRAIKGAHKRNPQPASTSKVSGYGGRLGAFDLTDNPKIKRFKLDENLNLETVPNVGCTIADFLDKVFLPGEIVCLGVNFTQDEQTGRYVPDRGSFATIEHIKASEGKVSFFNPKAGAYIRINPFKNDDARGNDAEVSDFRHLLVEFDKIENKREQLRIFKQSGLPIACVIDSGGKSLHAWIRVNADSLEQFKERQKLVYDYLSDYIDDDSNKNPARYSRLPGVMRGDNQQHVVSWEIGAGSFEEWENSNLDDGLPEDSDLSEFLSELIEEPKHIVQNFIRKGQVVSISGGMKTYKSWTAMELALAVTNGSRFVKWEANYSKVFYVDTELEEFDFQKRMLGIAEQMKISVDTGECRKMLLRGREVSIDMLVPGLIRRLQGKGYELIVIDAAYSLLGHREENRNEHISEFGRVLHKLAKETGAAVALVLHHSKGSQIGKRGIEKASGAGAWGRFVDMSLSIDQHPDEGCYNFETTYRSFAPEPAFVARRNGDIWSVETGLKVESKSSSAKQIGVTDILDVLVNECGGEASRKDWVEACAKSLGISAQTLDDRREKAAKQGLLDVSGKTKSMKTKLADGVVKNPETGRYEKKGKAIVALKSRQQSPEQPL
jgi:RecA-family ATPase